jgi:membrane-associated protease RseP (regulator of RpoE activity)
MNTDFSAINLFFSLTISLMLHEAGHVLAAHICRVSVNQIGFGCGPKLISVRIRGVDYQLRLLPIGAYIRMDMALLQSRSLAQQLVVLLAGIAVNIILGALTWGTFFGTLNVALALTNLLPLYQQDGWKTGIVICRHLLGRTSHIAEWSFTILAGMIGLAIVARAVTA